MFAPTVTHEHPWPYRTTRGHTGPTLWARSREGLAHTAAARWRRRPRDARRLTAPDDRMLRDVGLSRGEVEHAERRGGRAWAEHPVAGRGAPCPRGRSYRNRSGRRRLQPGTAPRAAEERMRDSTLPLRQNGAMYRPCRVADDDHAAWAVVEDVALGGGLCLGLWFLTGLAFLA